MIPTHVNMGAPGQVLMFLRVIPDASLKFHGAHNSGWCTYGLFELDAYICLDCGTLYVSTGEATDYIRRELS